MSYRTECKILVTGAAGLIGTEVSKSLRNLNFEILTLDLLEKDQQDQTIGTMGDIIDRALMRETLRDVAGIIHLAAVSRVADAEANPTSCTKINLEGTGQILNQMAKLNPKPWMIFASSREVYGEPLWLPVDERHPLAPINHYGRTKVACEEFVVSYAKTCRVPAAILRFGNVYSSVRDHETRVVPGFIRRAIMGQELEIQGGDQLLDLLHVKDAASAVVETVRLMDIGMPGCQVMNVASGIGTSMEELIEMVAMVTETEPRIKQVPAKPKCVQRFVADTSRMRDILGITDTIPLEQGLADMAEQFKAQFEPLQVVVA